MFKYFVLNLLLYPIEIIIKFYLLLLPKKKNNYVLLIIGNYASSTTLWLQILATFFKVNYINNISSKFYKCILVGQLINKILRKLGFKLHSNFYSEDGNTNGLLEPNEFGWYWRNFFTKEPSLLKLKKFHKNLNNILSFSDLPFLFKYSMTHNSNPLNKNYKYFNLIKKKLIIIYPLRKKNFVINSILNRKNKSKKFNSTYNFKKKDNLYKSINDQVQNIYREHDQFLKNFDKKKILYIDFEKFKENQNTELEKIINFFIKFGLQLNERNYINRNLKNLKFKKDIKKIKVKI